MIQGLPTSHLHQPAPLRKTFHPWHKNTQVIERKVPQHTQAEQIKENITLLGKFDNQMRSPQHCSLVMIDDRL